ncbi:flagellar hook assembly protein FlgD [Billgrantia kenyensis]|uniref:Basal-body rod modification protein FlgD n=1 Tax=Billgrantia kenyensis TaxID=321266 RepID=A0A7V9W1V6_9GAMM|nr:flagellar hook assembly protein FlgD [Halomonas kenyensis]MBA2779509.1 flagellar hook assembly protein FlgD [Halomonas kenyensis]MCG6662742.1 flagellar hook assembly protein FlgD [Halomonas kenyensis]
MSNTIDANVVTRMNQGGPSARDASQSTELRNNFMTLLIAQMQHQDPLNPMDNHEMTTQLAQINTVSGIEDLNKTLKGINDQMNAGQSLQAAGLIGQGVLVPGDRVLLEHDEDGELHTTPFGIELPRSADNVRVVITNASGQVVNRYDIGPVKAGVDSFTWDGRTSEGEAAASGSYRVRIEATSGDKAVDATTLNYAIVGGVTPPDDNGGVKLDLGAIYGQVGLDQIKQIL